MLAGKEERKLVQPEKPLSSLMIDGAIAPSERSQLIGDGDSADPSQIDARLQELEDEGVRRSGRMSMSPIMAQILRQQSIDIRQIIHQYSVLPTRNT